VSLVQLEGDLRRGLERQEFQVHYQPIVSLADGKITGVEALLRWQHPQRGLVFPAEFIPAAEATGLIEPIGEWMLPVACAQCKAWQKAGVPLTLAVNLSERQLEGDPVKIISRVLQNTGMDPHTLQIEIPETRLIESIHKILPRLQELKSLGIQISMDDFVGQSSLSSLERFPLDSVKIDRPLIERLINPEGGTIVRRMIAAALSLGLNVVAEGVETEEQLGFLRSNLCTLAQGYLLGRPASAQETTQLLLKGSVPDNLKPLKGRSKSREKPK
jgi:EAL domain-containing protein (putative c-di-GMP-specific phosphodiesterase class I)